MDQGGGGGGGSNGNGGGGGSNNQRGGGGGGKGVCRNGQGCTRQDWCACPAPHHALHSASLGCGQREFALHRARY